MFALQKKYSFAKILLGETYLSSDIVQEISDAFDKRMKLHSQSARTIQKSFRSYLTEKRYVEEMEDEGHTRLRCGRWSNGAQCMCDVCMGYEDL